MEEAVSLTASQLNEWVQMVLDVFPTCSSDLIRRDLLLTGSIDSTICRIADGTVVS